MPDAQLLTDPDGVGMECRCDLKTLTLKIRTPQTFICMKNLLLPTFACLCFSLAFTVVSAQH
ncbi:MAG: hypothetical protein ABIO24_14890, partial [Saprospiraceae bacterium]